MRSSSGRPRRTSQPATGTASRFRPRPATGCKQPCPDKSNLDSTGILDRATVLRLLRARSRRGLVGRQIRRIYFKKTRPVRAANPTAPASGFSGFLDHRANKLLGQSEAALLQALQERPSAGNEAFAFRRQQHADQTGQVEAERPCAGSDRGSFRVGCQADIRADVFCKGDFLGFLCTW